MPSSLLCAGILSALALQGAAPMVGIQRQSSDVAVGFTGQLQSAGKIEGPYTNLLTTNPHRQPFTVVPQQFWRSAMPGAAVLAAGFGHSVGITTDGGLWGWGQNGHGQLSNAVQDRTNRPVRIGPGNEWSGVACGHSHTMALKTDGSLWAMGNNSSGQLGIGTTQSTNVLVQVGAESNWVSVVCGWYYTLALKADGSLWGWGTNRHGQLGPGVGTATNQPTQIETDTDWVTVATKGFEGFGFTVALKANGSLWGWGLNADGQLGVGSTFVHTNRPLRIGAETNWTGAVCGDAHTVALKNDGSLWVWGENRFGQLGNEVPNSTNQPTRIGTLSDWTAVACGAYHTVALKIDGSLWSWGVNTVGQLGNGTSNRTNQPVRIGGESNWTAVASGSDHAFARKADGSLWSWGNNEQGQAGIGTYVNTNRPTRVDSDADWAESQMVYSENVVGLINVVIPPGYSIIGNQLNTGRNQTERVIPNPIPPLGMVKFNGTFFNVNYFEFPPAGPSQWGDPEQPLNPGQGAFLLNESRQTYSNTFVGDVPQGTLHTPLRQGLNLVASQVPQEGLVQSQLGFPANPGDQIYRFTNTGNPASSGYLIYTYEAPPGGGAPQWDEEPVISAGEGFFVRKVAGTTWTRTFNVSTP